MSWRMVIGALVLLCGQARSIASARELSFQQNSFDTTRRHSATNNTSRRLRSRRELQDTAIQVARVQNIQLIVEQAAQVLESGEQELLEEILEGWFLRFYESDMGSGVLGSVESTNVVFQSQVVDGSTSIITYDQTISYTPLSETTAPEAFILRPYGSLDGNALLSLQLSAIPTWNGRPSNSFLSVPVVLGALPTNAPTTMAPTTLAPTTLAPSSPAPTAFPTMNPAIAPTTLAPSSPAPTAFPTAIPTIAPTGSPAVGATSAPSVPSETNTSSPEPPTESPSVPETTFISVSLENLELVYNNVDNINDAQLEIIEDETQDWFNDFYRMIATDVSGVFAFRSTDYSDRSLTVLFDVMLEFEGQEDRALEILQQPWNDVSSVGSYRQLLITALPDGFQNVEGTEPPKFRERETSPAPTPDEGLSRRAIVRIVVIIFAVIVLAVIVALFQLRKRKGPDSVLPKNNTAPYSPHLNEDDDDTLFPEANVKPSGPRRIPPSEKDEQSSYEGKSVDTNDFDYSKVGANTVAPGSRFSSATPSVASGMSNPYTESDLHTQDAEDQFVIYAPAGKLGLVVDNRDDGPPVIHSIKEDSVLIDQIQAGDRLIGVDEVDVRTLSPVRVSKLISKRSTNPLRKLTLTREKPGRNDESTFGDQSSFVGSMSRMSGVDTDTQNDALGQGFSSDEETSYVASMSRVSGDDQSLDDSTAAMK